MTVSLVNEQLGPFAPYSGPLSASGGDNGVSTITTHTNGVIVTHTVVTRQRAIPIPKIEVSLAKGKERWSNGLRRCAVFS